MGESNITLDTKVLTDSLNSVGASIKDFIIEYSHYIVGIICFALVLWLAIEIFKIIKSIFWRWFS